MSEKEEAATMSIDAAAKEMNLGRAQTYQAAHRGEIPTIRIGKRILVLTVPFRRLLRGENQKAAG